MRLTILVRADAPAYTVATALVRRLDFRLARGVDRRLRVSRPDPDPEAGDMTVLTVADHRSDDRLWGGYDVALTGSFEDEMLAWELVGEIRSLGWPVLLVQDSRTLLAWSPTHGSRTADTEFDEPASWHDFVLPRVTAPVAPAPDDTLGVLYARILADPDDEDLRLSYADAVADSHPSYARLIREQITHTRHRREHRDEEALADPYTYDLASRIKNEMQPVDDWDLLGDGFHLRGGFVEEIFMRADAFVTLAARLVAAYPLRMLHLSAVTPAVLPALAAVPELARVRGLSFRHCRLDDTGLTTLIGSPHLTGLRWLDLSRTGVTEVGIEALAAADTTPQLRYVVADPALRLNPEPGYDWTGALVYVGPATLSDRLGARYPAAWLHRDSGDVRGYPCGEPRYDEV